MPIRISTAVLAFFVSGTFAGPVASDAAKRFPCKTTIHCGEIMTAQLTLGTDVAAACMPGRDAIPAFASVWAYENYYRVDGDSNCDLDCLRPTYKAMRAAGLMTPLISGEAVTVTSVRADPEDRRYRICGVRVKSRSWVVLCDALDEQP
jgi:hypothetical protein